MTSSQPVALVTGASSGIGGAAAAALAEAGFEVIGTGRSTRGLAKPDGVTLIDLDVTDEESVSAGVGRVLDRLGRLDVLVNNAGVGSTGAAEESSVAVAQQVFDVNLYGVIRMTRAVLPHMRERGSGRIINVSSVLGMIPAPYGALYAASKHALEGYSESLDHEVREHGVRVLLVEPGFTRTNFASGVVPADALLPVYEQRRRSAAEQVTAELRGGDSPDVVAASIVAAATDRRPKLRYPAGSGAGRIATLRRLAPAGAFDKQMRKFYRLAG